MQQVIWRTWFAFCLVFLLFGHIQAADHNFKGKRFKAWSGNCEPGQQAAEVCYLEQVLMQNGEEALRAIIGYARGRPNPTVFFELPLGADIEAGVTLQVDNAETIRFRGRCTQLRCSAGFIMDQTIRQQFIKGRKAAVSYMPASGQEPIVLPVSLMGVTAGLNALQQHIR